MLQDMHIRIREQQSIAIGVPKRAERQQRRCWLAHSDVGVLAGILLGIVLNEIALLALLDC